MFVTTFAYLMHWSISLGHSHKLFRPIIRKGNELIFNLCYRAYIKKGESAWDSFWVPAMVKLGQVRAPHIKKTMMIDVNNPKQLGAYHDYEDPIFGVTGHWETNENGDPVRVETACQLCDHIMKVTNGKGCPEFCRRVVGSMEQATGQAMNDTYVVEIESLLVEGEASCRFIHKLHK